MTTYLDESPIKCYFCKNFRLMNFKHSLTIILLCFTFLAQGQKFGHLNSNQLLLDVPQIKTADQQLNTFSSSLEKEYVAKVQAFESEYNVLVEKANSKEFSQVQIEREQAELAKKQEVIQKFEQESQQKLLQKREELYAPILKKVDDAIKAVGDENDFTMIFDTSSGFILHGQESQDVTSLVKAKLSL